MLLAAALSLILAVGATVGCRPAVRPAQLSASEEASAGLASLARGEATRAAGLLENAIRAGDSSDQVVRALASSYVLTGQPGRAVAALKDALERRPRDASLWHLLGSLQAQMGDSAGLESLTRAASLSSRWDLWRDLGEAQAASGDRVRGARSLERAWGKAPPGPVRSQVAAQAADLEAALGRRAAARKWYRRALADDPTNAVAKRGLERLGRPH